MVQYCRKCGKELEDDAEFCDECGFLLDDNPTKDKTNNKVISSSDNKPIETNNNEFINKLPLIVVAIAIILAIFEGLGTPMLMGWDNIHVYWSFW